MTKLIEKMDVTISAYIELAYAAVFLGALFCSGSAFMTTTSLIA
jgi:cytochrome c oxidase assembly protein Cox11